MGFSSFRGVMDRWDRVCEGREQVNMVHQLLDAGGEFVFYFKFEGSVYGAPEESRIVFAKIMRPKGDEADVRGANFVAANLGDLLKGKASQQVFSEKDVKKIKVVGKEDAAEELGKVRGGR